MAVPEFQSMMLPILELHADNKPHATHELYCFIVLISGDGVAYNLLGMEKYKKRLLVV